MPSTVKHIVSDQDVLTTDTTTSPCPFTYILSDSIDHTWTIEVADSLGIPVTLLDKLITKELSNKPLVSTLKQVYPEEFV